MSTKVYATGFHMQRANYACYGVSVLRHDAPPKDFFGQFESENKTGSQLQVLLFAISVALESKEQGEIEINSDFVVLKDIAKMEEMVQAQWQKADGKLVKHLDLWKKLHYLMTQNDITFSPITKSNKVFDKTFQLARQETRLPKNTKTLLDSAFLEQLEE